MAETGEQLRIILDEISKNNQLLEVDADEYKDSEDSHIPELVSKYEATLRNLSQCVSRLERFLLKAEDQKRAVLKRNIPVVIIDAAAHTGKHYWTSASSRKQANMLVSSILHCCGCGSVTELLVGKDCSEQSLTSPYVHQAPDLSSSHSEPPDRDNKDIERKEERGGEGEREEAVDEEKIANGGRREDEALADVHYENKDSEKKQVLASDSDTGPGGKQSKEGGGGTVLSEGQSAHAIEDVVASSEQKPALVFRAGLLKDILSVLRAKLTRDSWKRYPSAKHGLLWCLKHLKHPHVSPHINSFLPPLLMLIDDHESYHKVLGLSGLQHLVRNVDSAELRWHGRSEVIYKAVFSLLYSDEVNLIHALHPFMLRLLPVVEGPPPRTVHGPRKPTVTDEVFAILLDCLDRETKIASRKAYLTHIRGYVELLGIYVVRHLKHLLSVLFSCMEFPDYSGEETRQIALKTLATVMKYAWPRVPYHHDEILRVLLKLISDVCPSADDIPNTPDVQGQLPLVTECLVLMARTNEKSQVMYRELLNGCQHQGLALCLNRALELLSV